MAPIRSIRNPPPLDVIRLSSLQVHCVVGMYRDERVTPQTLELEVALHLDTRAAAHGGGIAASVDYARLCGELKFLLESARFLLLEDAAEALSRYILLPPAADGGRAQVQEVSVKISKPQALGGGARASIEVHRRAKDCVYQVEDNGMRKVDVVHEGPNYQIARLRIQPHGFIPTHVHQQMVEHELVLGSNLLLQTKRVAPGTAFVWPKGHAHRYDNPSDTEQSVLCVDAPNYLPADEILTSEPKGGLICVPERTYYPKDAQDLDP